MKIYKHIAEILTKIGFVLLLSILWINPASAHRSPADCLGSSLGIVLYVYPGEAQIGDSVSYTVDVFNDSPGSGKIVCDASSITASLTTPDGIVHPISLGRTTLTNGQRDTYSNVVTYIIRAQDVIGGILRATASDSGVIHQNDSNSQGGSFQYVNVTVISPPVVVVSSPSPSPTLSPSPSPSPTYSPSPSPSYSPSSIPSTPSSPSGSGGGTTSGGGITYGCKDQNALNYNYFSVSNPALCIYTATSTIVSPVVVTTTVTPTVVISKLPKTGFPPKEENIPWNITMLAGVLILVSTSLVVILRKNTI